MKVFQHQNGGWFTYGQTRTLGPFKNEAAAWKALREEGEE